MSEKPRLLDFGLREQLIARAEWCFRCDKPSILCLCQPLEETTGEYDIWDNEGGRPQKLVTIKVDGHLGAREES